MRIIITILFFSAFSQLLHSQHLNSDLEDSAAQTTSADIYFGTPGGVIIGGGTIGISGNFIINKKFGGSVSFKGYIFDSKNIPDDFGSKLFPPTDGLTVTSFMFISESQAENRKLRLGIEIGPSIVVYRETEFRLNPAYDDPCTSFFSCPSKYLTDKIKIGTSVGLSLRVKIKFPFSRSFGFEIAPVAIVNQYRSTLGIETCLIFGLVNSELRPILEKWY